MSKTVELCEVCKRRKHTKLCDFATFAGIVSTADFRPLTQTCDNKICDKCAVGLWADCDICPDHAKELKKILLKEPANDQ